MSEDILDNMGSDELIANLFRISQTEQKSKNNNIKGENNANITQLPFKIYQLVLSVIKQISAP